MLINKKYVRQLALDTAKEYRGGKFVRVSASYYAELDGKVKQLVRDHVRALPSVGKTIK